ncbi:hypothetical protein HELRODRAFT_106160, partial [Helobdella robusta]|uniref:PDZ domain-containing protein n=1 Tax=Helobdella robusta TaxID=6412 RepID=T1EE06_HELRO
MFTFLESSTLSRKMKLAARMETGLLEIKSKFDAEFRRFSIDLKKDWSLESFQNFVRDVHRLHNIPFDLTYTDHEGDLLPLNNEENFHHALNVCRPLLRLVVQHKGSLQYGYGTVAHGRKNIISRLLEGDHQVKNYPCKNISQPENFRCVSAIIDVDILPATQRRVKLMKSQSDKPLGFFVRDGYSIHPTSTGQLERIPGIFISRLVPGGLAASTGLLAVNDEVLEVNGIEVAGKTLDQVTDMMVANSSNLIITIKPCNQHTNIKMN